MFTIGCHLSIAKGFAAAARDAGSIGANTFQFFTRNPRGGKAKPLDDGDLEAFAAAREQFGIQRILAHAPYTMNPSSPKPGTRDFALQTLADDFDRMERIMPGQLYNMHPGAHVPRCRLASRRRCSWRPWPARGARSGVRSRR